MQKMNPTVTELQTKLATGELRCTDLAEQIISRTHAASSLNCYVTFDEKGLREQALAAHRRLDAGERLPLLGVPISVKDNIQVAGLPCGNGTAALHGKAVSNDASLVTRLREAGALITGTVGMHELALGATTNNGHTGAVRNPWDTSRIPGGSSGGSGAVVAAGLVPASIGTDTGGSVRIPAALCGVVGFRPTVGRVNGKGLAPIAKTRDTAGPIANTVADLALLDGVLTGNNEPLGEVPLMGLKLGLPKQFFWEDLNPGVEKLTHAALERLGRHGVELVPVSMPNVEQLNSEVSFVVALFELVRDLSRYLEEEGRGVSFEEVVRKVASPDVAAVTTSILGKGAVPEAAYVKALETRQKLQALYREMFASSGVQAVLLPSCPATAPLIGEDESFMHNGRPCPTFPTLIRNTDPGSNAAIPGLTLPVGLAENLPVGLALDGPAGSDRKLLSIGKAIESILAPMPNPPTNF